LEVNSGPIIRIVKTTSDWAIETQPLAINQQGFEVRPDGKIITKFGDGTSLWGSLSPVKDGYLSDIVGNLSDLDTQDKTNLVNAINSEIVRAKSAESTEQSDRIAADINLQSQVDAQAGRGGPVGSYDFGKTFDSPIPESDQKVILVHMADYIWPGRSAITWAEPLSASTFDDASGNPHTLGEIFNATWVRNEFDQHRIVITNTPDTTPPVFDLADVGQDIVSMATDTLAGVVKLYQDTDANNADGPISQAALKSAIGQPNKIAGLGSDGRVPTSQLPTGLALPDGYIYGFALAPDVDGNLVVGPGTAKDASNASAIVLTANITKTLEPWAAGNGNGGLVDGVEPVPGMKLYAIAMTRSSDGATEVALDTDEAGSGIATTAAIQAWGAGGGNRD
jgi:hypothetical protein